MIFAIDAMGGDNAPEAPVLGALAAFERLGKDVTIRLYGDEKAISDILSGKEYPADRLTIVPTTGVIGCDESPTAAIRQKKDSSLVRAIRAVADGEADCVISAGNSGALLAGGTLIIKRIPGVKRPALAPVLPTVTGGKVVLCDSGANADCKPEYLVQFAMMGAAYMKGMYDVDDPRVGLLNNGAEEEKGSELTKAAYQLLKTAPVNFAGNCEARDALGGDFDVVACDGFSGNILLKGVEGTAGMMMKLLKQSMMSSLRCKIGALLCKPAFRTLKHSLDYTSVGGAPLLGVNGGVIKAHGSSDAKAMMNAIYQAERLTRADITGMIRNAMAELATED